MDSQEEFFLICKILLIGDARVGKTNLLLRYCENNFLKTYLSTIGVDLKITSIDVEGKKIKMQFFDTSGQEIFRNVTQSYFKGAHAIILVYSIDDRESFNNIITKWMNLTKQLASENVCILLIGNKIDLSNRQVSRDEGDAFARQFGFLFFETSAKKGTNVTDAFYAIAKEVKENLKLQKEKLQKEELPNQSAEKKQCCIF